MLHPAGAVGYRRTRGEPGQRYCLASLADCWRYLVAISFLKVAQELQRPQSPRVIHITLARYLSELHASIMNQAHETVGAVVHEGRRVTTRFDQTIQQRGVNNCKSLMRSGPGRIEAAPD